MELPRRKRRDSFDEASTSASASTLTTTIVTRFYYGKRSMDNGSTSPMITKCYKLSEVSIEGSVTTVKGHDNTVGNNVVVEEKWKLIFKPLVDEFAGIRAASYSLRQKLSRFFVVV
ncbi:hypothetical protein JHK87_000775 [Glycine soja]|nr:hypothetical protein JHK87_000775 [Glycine soja]